MASIQCAIELHDGVSPVLRDMAVALEGFGGRLLRFGEEMEAVSPDTGGILIFRDALRELEAEAGGAYARLSAVLAVGEGMSGVFSAEIFSPLTDGAAAAVEEMEKIAPAAQACAAELVPVFSPLGEEMRGVFEEMAGGVIQIFDRLGGQIAAFAGGLPGHFTGPLGQIAGMFADMAASARASMDAIAGRAAATAGAISAMSSAVARAHTGPSSAGGERVSMLTASGDALTVDGGEQLLPTRAADSLMLDGGEQLTLLAVPDSRVLDLPEPEVYLRGDPGRAVSPAQVTLTVQNENYIASEVDVEAVLRDLEIRLADAVASSVEGVYG